MVQKSNAQGSGVSVLSPLAAWSASAASMVSLASRSMGSVESPAARLGRSAGSGSRGVLPIPMNSLESESSDGSSSDYDCVNTNNGEENDSGSDTMSSADLDEKLASETYRMSSGLPFNYAHRPGLIRIMRNTSIRTLLPATINSITAGTKGIPR